MDATALGIGAAAVFVLGLVVFISKNGKGRATVKTPVGTISADGSPRPTVAAEEIDSGGRVSVAGQSDADVSAKKIKASGDVEIGHAGAGENKIPKAKPPAR